MSQDQKITTERRGHLLVIGFNRANKMNAFDSDAYDARDALAQLENDPELRCGVIYAEGDPTTAGLDLADIAPKMSDGSLDLAGRSHRSLGGAREEANEADRGSSAGTLLDSRIELCLAQDVCIAASNARFAQIEIKRGIFLWRSDVPSGSDRWLG